MRFLSAFAIATVSMLVLWYGSANAGHHGHQKHARHSHAKSVTHTSTVTKGHAGVAGCPCPDCAKGGSSCPKPGNGQWLTPPASKEMPKAPAK